MKLDGSTDARLPSGATRMSFRLRAFLGEHCEDLVKLLVNEQQGEVS